MIKQRVNISNFKDLNQIILKYLTSQNLENMSTFEKPNVRHKFGNPKGGMNLYDEGNVIPGAIKEFSMKLANKIVKA